MNASSHIFHIQKSAINLLANFLPIFLEDIPTDSQMSRFDRKYIFPGFMIPSLIKKANGSYRVLEINGKRILEYKSQYFDTPDFGMYHAHHNQKAERYKIRIREYVESKEFFLEIKKKTNKGLTIKHRIPQDEPSISNKQAKDLIRNFSPYSAEVLKPSVSTDFKRFTLVNKNGWERITLDSCISLCHNDKNLVFPWLGIAEIKKPDQHTMVKFEEILKEKGIRPRNFSKYCIGMASMNETIKSNNFKENLLSIKQFENEYFNHFKHQ